MTRSTKVLLAIAYFFWPIDAIPDLILGIGWADDLAVLAYAIFSANEEAATVA